MEDCTAITNGIDGAVEDLRDEFSSLEHLITRHEDLEELRETADLANWVAQGDHIEMEQDIQNPEYHSNLLCFLAEGSPTLRYVNEGR